MAAVEDAQHDPLPPTPASFVNTIDLFSTTDSKITAVSVYTGRAEVTRLFKFSVRTGQNHVSINGLPSVLDQESLRVEGRGPATIHDVTTSEMSEPPESERSATLIELTERKKRLSKALERSNKLHEALEEYLSSLKIEHVGALELDQVVEGYESTGGKLDEKILNLESELQAVEDEIEREEEKSSGIERDKLAKLRSTVSLSLFSEKESEVELIVIYAVVDATWTAVYDVRVDMQATKTPVTLVYKAAITQDTGEDWDDVPLTLETATPTFQVGIPTLNSWNLTFTRPLREKQTARMTSQAARAAGSGPALRSESDDESSSNLFGKSRAGPMRFRDAVVTSKGNVSATFTVPGTITIPSDDAAHNVTIAKLPLDAAMSWIAVPKVDARARLSAKITNASEYTLLAGVGSIYVDGSFISKSNLPAASPGESFDCALGLDPAIRITYHPLTKKTAQTGFYTKTTVSSLVQRVTVHNTKSITITDLRIIDQIPVSSDEKITVKLISPTLHSVTTRNDISIKNEKKAERALLNPRIQVAEGVTAEWGDGMEDPAAIEDGTALIGQDGRLSWICKIASQRKLSLLLEWEVTAPARSRVYNL